MTLARTTIAALTVAIAGTLAPNAAAATYHSVDVKATNLQRKAAGLYWEFNAHFRHSAHFGHLRSDAAQLYGLARDIHLLAHRSHGLDQMAYKLDRADALFHHMEELIEHIVHDAEHGHGHIHGDLCHVRSQVESFERTLHNLRAEVRDLRYYQALHFHDHFDDHYLGGHGVHGHSVQRHGVNRHSVRRHSDHRREGGSISFGNGSFRIRFGR